MNQQVILALNDTLDQMDFIDIYRTFHPKEAFFDVYLKRMQKKICTLFKYTWGIFKGRPHDRTQNKPQQI